MMRVLILGSAQEASVTVAKFIAGAVREHPDLVLGLPTGRTPVRMYESLIALHREGKADFSRASTFHLDEFIGVSPRDPRSYHSFLRRHLLDHINVPRSHIHVLNGAARDWRREAEKYERTLTRVGGLDLAIIGIGRNGHVGFNEPADRLQPRTHLARLEPATRRSNAHLFDGRWRSVPTHALSMGMATILNARAVVLLALGAPKAAIVRRALAGPLTPRVPASFLQLHPNAMVVLDKPAGARL